MAVVRCLQRCSAEPSAALRTYVALSREGGKHVVEPQLIGEDIALILANDARPIEKGMRYLFRVELLAI